MTNNLKIFENPEFGKIRTLEINNAVWFVGKDVAEALGYVDTAKALTAHVDEEDKHLLKVGEMPTLKTSNYGAYIINESGLYSLVLASKLPTAKQFKRWVTAEVLPTIRKTGGYIDGSKELSDEEIMAKALLVAQNTIKAKEERIKSLENDTNRMRPKEIFADAVSASDTTILIGDLAKLIKQNGHAIGQKRLFQWLRENGYLIKRNGADYNSPTQKAMELGLFKIKETAITHSDGHTTITKTTKVSGKGQQYFINKFASIVYNPHKAALV